MGKPLSVMQLRKTYIAAAIFGLGLPPVWAGVTASGDYAVYPGGGGIGPGDTDLGPNSLWVGDTGTGSAAVTEGSSLSAASFILANQATGVGDLLLDGQGTRLMLTGDGNSRRLMLGHWGHGNLTVSGGAVLDGRANASACLLGAELCQAYVGRAAGADATLTVSGANSSASFIRSFIVGGVEVYAPLGTAGGATHASVNVLAGGLLTVDNAYVAMAPGGSSPTGLERSFASVVVDGVGSTWRLTGGTLDGSGAFLNTALHPNASATLTVSNGGALWVDGKSGVYNNVFLTNGGGSTVATIKGAGSKMLFTGDAGYLNVGQNLGGASMSVLDGAVVSGMFYTAVGRNGSSGTLLIDGLNSKLLINGTASAEANGSPVNPAMDIGRSGTGLVTVSGGGNLSLVATKAYSLGNGINIGRDVVSSGILNIDGEGSLVELSAASVVPGGGAGEASNPFMRVGMQGHGELAITNGGKLLIDGGAVSIPGYSRSTNLIIGGYSDTAPGGDGTALVTGAGSEIRLTGSDTYIGVGQGRQSSGQLTVSDHAVVSAIGMNVGRSGGFGDVTVENATLAFSGQQTGGTSGAYLSIGRSDGVGSVTVNNHSVVTLKNYGSAGATLSLGGTGSGPLGDGTLLVSGSSQVRIQAEPGLATLSVARDGNALVAVSGSSTVDLGDGSVYVGRLGGSNGTVLLSGGSMLTAGWVGVGRDKNASGNFDGGTGKLILTNSTLAAQEIVVGSNGFLGGTGQIIGDVTNYGVFSPGSSPGTIEITGSFQAKTGSRLILEVQSNGHGGYLTDQVVFGQGQVVDLSHLAVEFRFLGHTNPIDFKNKGLFDTDTFFRVRDAGGGTGGLSDGHFDGIASFSASATDYTLSNFTFSAAGGANFSAQAVPEPATWGLMVTGFFLVRQLSRKSLRRQSAAP